MIGTALLVLGLTDIVIIPIPVLQIIIPVISIVPAVLQIIVVSILLFVVLALAIVIPVAHKSSSFYYDNDSLGGLILFCLK